MNISPDGETDTSLEDDLRAAFASANEAPEPEVAPVVDAVAEPVAETAEEAAGRERDEHGRFKAKEAQEAPVEPETPVAEAPVAEDPDKIAPDPYGLAPTYASPAVKEKWAALDGDVREWITKRDREVHQTFTRYDEERNFGKQIKEIAKPYEALITSLGANVPTAVDYLLKTDYVLRTGTPDAKRSALLKAAQDYGIDLSGAPQPAETQVATDPRYETLQQRIDRLESERNNDMTARREEVQQTINSQIDSFASKPENVYFDRVKPLMATYLTSGQAESLEKAYEMAVWADPETRALHLAAERAAEDRKRTMGAAEQAAKARRASPSVTGAPGSAVPPPQLNGSSGSVEDDLRAAFQAVSGRA